MILKNGTNWARNNTRFSGPTEFAPLLEQVKKVMLTEISSIRENKFFYKVVQILTDGSIHDMISTCKIIVEMANTLPVSIIIVGIGNKDSFEKMKKFDYSEDIPFEINGLEAYSCGKWAVVKLYL